MDFAKHHKQSFGRVFVEMMRSGDEIERRTIATKRIINKEE